MQRKETILQLFLKEIREKLNISQEQIATICGISRQYYGLIESGERKVPVWTAKKIAAALGFDWQRFYED
ncbi:MAG: helix-turn-helix transcriptional regulator [Clostridiales bacterium]|nr:helix-turn-helix transcriptional regulator [Clostridiales bacterium]